MSFSVNVTGRRLSDGQEYELNLKVEANQEDDVLDHIEQHYDWSDAAIRNVQISQEQ